MTAPDLPTAAAKLKEAIDNYLNDRNPSTEPGIRLALAADVMLRAWEERVRAEQELAREMTGLADLQKGGIGG